MLSQWLQEQSWTVNGQTPRVALQGRQLFRHYLKFAQKQGSHEAYITILKGLNAD
jgi:hypothetical protein